MIDWAEEIKQKTSLKLRLREVYTLIPHYPPEPPATESQILEVENHLGFPLDPQYRSFLRFANGWKGFVHLATLFGTDDLLGRTSLMEEACRGLSYFNPSGVFSDGKLRNDDVLVIGESLDDLDRLMLGKPHSQRPGQVLRIIGSDIEEFADFHELFRASVLDDRFFLESETST